MSDFDTQILASPTHQKIKKLYNQIRSPSSGNKVQFGNTNVKIQQLKNSISHGIEQMHEKVSMANAYLNEVEKEANETLSKCHKLKVYPEDPLDSSEQIKHFFSQLDQECQESSRSINKRVLEMKMRLTEIEESEKLTLEFERENTFKPLLTRIRKQAQASEHENLLQKQIDFEERIHDLKKLIQNQMLMQKESQKEVKKNILGMCEKVEKDVKQQQQILKQSFQMHFMTLQKLVGTITDRIK